MNKSLRGPTRFLRHRRHQRLFLTLLVAVGILLWRTSTLYWMFELKTLDQRFRARGPRPVGEAVVLIAIDQPSLQRLGPYPWPRRWHARLIEALHRDQARAIVFDVLFLDPARNPQEDRQLAAATRRAGCVFFAALGLETGLPPPWPEALKARLNYFSYPYQPSPTAPVWSYALQFPIAPLLREARGLGFVNVTPDEPDPLHRWANLVVQDRGRLWPSLPLSVAQYLLHVSAEEVRFDLGRAIHLGSVHIPVNRAARLLINYPGGPGTFPTYSYADALAGAYPPGTFRGKVVLIGATAPGLADTRASPFFPVHPAVEIQATILNNILHQEFLTLASPTVQVALILVLSLLPGLLFLRLNQTAGAFLILLVLSGYVGLCFHLFAAYHLYLELMAPTLALALSYVVVSTSCWLTEAAALRDLQRTMERYVAPPVMREILRRPDQLSLQGERREVTVLFADIVDFTDLAAQYPPEIIVELLNEFFTAMTQIVFRYGGVVDKFIGDSLMAVFNVPIQAARVDHAAQAIKSALAMQELLPRLCQRWEREGRPTFSLAIGINTGQVVVGNLGSEDRMEYSVIGDAVNIAARLQELCRAYEAKILVGEETYRYVQDAIRARFRGEAQVRKRPEPVRVYEVLGLRTDALETEPL